MAESKTLIPLDKITSLVLIPKEKYISERIDHEAKIPWWSCKIPMKKAWVESPSQCTVTLLCGERIIFKIDEEEFEEFVNSMKEATSKGDKWLIIRADRNNKLPI